MLNLDFFLLNASFISAGLLLFFVEWLFFLFWSSA